MFADISNIVSKGSISLRNALKLIDSGGKAILLLVDDSGKLLRCVTDGDIRRLLLSGHPLESNLCSLESKEPVSVGIEADPVEVLALMDKFGVNHVPVVGETGLPIGLHLRSELPKKILLSNPHMGTFEMGYVQEAFDSNWIAPLGPNVDAFEAEMAEYLGVSHAAAVSSGTAAIHLALRLLDVSVGDRVFCSDFTFVASANPIKYLGAEPVFIDSDWATWNMCPNSLEIALADAKKAGNLPKAILVVHLYGQSANMAAIMQLSEIYGVPVIEDAAESLGAKCNGVYTGTIGKFGIFSFNGNKIITTSGGGMLVSEDKDLIARARYLSTQARADAPHYEHTEVGYNYRMSNILAGIGRGQLQVLHERVLARRKVFENYRQGLTRFRGLEWMPEPNNDYSNRWLSAMRVNPDYIDKPPSTIIGALAEYQIEARHFWKPMHMQPLFKHCGFYSVSNTSPVSMQLFYSGVCLPSGSDLTEIQQARVINAVEKVLLE